MFAGAKSIHDLSLGCPMAWSVGGSRSLLCWAPELLLATAVKQITALELELEQTKGNMEGGKGKKKRDEPLSPRNLGAPSPLSLCVPSEEPRHGLRDWPCWRPGFESFTLYPVAALAYPLCESSLEQNGVEALGE